MTENKVAFIGFCGAMIGAMIPAGCSYFTSLRAFNAEEALLVSKQQPAMSSNIRKSFNNYIDTCEILAESIKTQRADNNNILNLNLSYYSLKTDLEVLQLFMYRFRKCVSYDNFEMLNKIPTELDSFHQKILSFHSENEIHYGTYWGLRDELQDSISKFIDASRQSALSILRS